MGIPITARYPKVRADWIYLFNDSEIMRVKVMSRKQLIAIMISYVILLFIIGVPTLLFVPPGIGLPILIILLGVGIGFPYLSHSFRERQVSELSVEDAAKRKSTRHIPWSSITAVELNGYSMKIREGNNHYKVYLFDPDADSITNLVMSKLGKKVIIK